MKLNIVEPNLMLIILRILVKVRWVELGGTDSLSIYYLKPGFDSLFYWHHFHSDQTYKIILVSTPQPLVGRPWAVKCLCRGKGWYHLCSCQLSADLAVAALNFFSVLFQPSQEVGDCKSDTIPFSLNTGFPASWTDYQSDLVEIPTYIWKQLV